MTKTSSFARVAALAIAGGMLWMPAQASAQSSIVQDLVGGFGLLKTDKPDIDYRERPGLVVPPSRDLPAPQEGSAAASNPNWPTDPDVARRQQTGPRSHDAPAGAPERARLQEDPRMSAEDLRAGRVASNPREYERMAVGNLENPRISPDELRRGNVNFQAQKTKQRDLSTRPRLSDPPTKFLQPSPNAPVSPDGSSDVPGQKKSWLSRMNPFN